MKKIFSLFAAGMLAMTACAQQTTTLKPAVAISDNANAGTTAAPATEVHFDGKGWWNYVKVLAADGMEGRETGSVGLHKAQEYVVEQLKHAGLEPAGAKGFYQPVHFVSRQIMEKDLSLQSLGVKVQTDPEPQRNAFIRSDQYNFIRHGVPALAMGVGLKEDRRSRNSSKPGGRNATMRLLTTWTSRWNWKLRASTRTSFADC